VLPAKLVLGYKKVEAPPLSDEAGSPYAGCA